MSRILRNILATAVIIIIFVFLLRNLILNWTKIPFEDLQVNVPLLGLSFCALVLHFVSYSKSWQKIMHALGAPINFAQSIWMIATTQIGKYLPGKVWYMIGRVYVGKKASIEGKSLALSMVLETCLLHVTGGIIFLITTVIAGSYNISWIIMSIILISVAIIILHPKILGPVVNFFLRILKKPEIKSTLAYHQIIQISVYFFGLWIGQVIGFYFLVRAIYPIPPSYILNLASAYTLAWISGSVAIFAPGGLGVREGVMTLLLSPILPMPLAIAISFIARVWITAFEVVVFFIGLVIQRRTESKISP
ncbi:MAG: lysylphosphatidylglycerol synthase domain-containing protein [bacterium]